MVSCVPHSSYLDSPDFLANSLHVLTCFEIPVLTYGGYCILFKTPKEMSSVKWMMIELHVITTFSDLLISFLGKPYVLLPMMAGYGLGHLDSPALLYYLLVTTLCALAAAVATIYENRYFTLFGRNSKWRYARKPVLTSVYFMVPLFFVPPYFDVPDQQFARDQILLSLPCLPTLTYMDRKMYVIALSYTIPFTAIAVATQVLGTMIVVFGVLIFYNIFKKKAMASSSKTQKMQKRFAIAFAIQSAYLLLALLTPIIVALIVIILQYHRQAINNFIFIVLSLHGTGSTVVMILVHQPYRDFTFALFSCRKLKKRTRMSTIMHSRM